MSRSLYIRSGVLAVCLMTVLYPTLSAAQQPAGPAIQPTAPPSTAYPQQPPPGYYPQQQPPPGHYPQQPLPPRLAEDPEPAFRRGFLAMPYIGVQIPVGDFGDVYDAGLRLGTLLGGHISPILSLNGELTIDVLNLKNVPSGVDLTEVIVDMLFSPLLHFGNDTIEAFIGPKLGVFGYSASASSGGREAKASAQGMAYGLNLGAGIPVGNLAVGGLFSWVGRHATEACVTDPGESEVCDDSPSGDDAHTIAFTGFVLF